MVEPVKVEEPVGTGWLEEAQKSTKRGGEPEEPTGSGPEGQQLNIGKDMSPEEAAANTWTERLAASVGYPRVKIVSDTPHVAVVTFERKE